MHLKCLIVTSNKVYFLHINFCEVPFTRTQDLHFPKNSEKENVTAAPPIKLCPQKLHQCHRMQNFEWFHAIESEIDLSQKFWKKKGLQLFLLSYMYRNFSFYAISFSRNRDQLITKIPEKVLQQRYLLSDCPQKMIDINLC